MGSFTERASARKDKDARFRAMINDAARSSFLTQLEQHEIARSRSINRFKNIGLYDFLLDSVSHAKSVDGHHDARIEFDFHEGGRWVDRIYKEDYPERKLLLKMIKNIGTVAIAEVRWDMKTGEVADGYTGYQVLYSPEQPRRIIVRGREETADIFLDFWNTDEEVSKPDDQMDEGLMAAFKEGLVYDAIIDAYFDPNIQLPLFKHPDDLPNPEQPPSQNTQA